MARKHEQILREIVIKMENRKWIKSPLSLRCFLDSGSISRYLDILIDRGLVEAIPNIRMPNKRHHKSIKAFYALTELGKRTRTGYIQR